MIAPRLLFTTLVASLGAVLLAAIVTATASIDLRIYDALIRWAGVASSSRRVAVVAVDESSLDAIGPWPWSRDLVDELIDRIGALGASVVAVDTLMSSGAAPRSGPSGDHFAVVTGYAMTFGGAAADSPGCQPLPLVTTGEPPPMPRLFKATGSTCPSAGPPDDVTLRSGFLNVGTDPDGIVRRLPLVMSYGGALYPSLALAATQALLAPGRMALASRSDRPLQLEIEGRNVPLGERGTLALRFRDSQRPLNHIPAADVLHGGVAPGALDGRVVLVGATAAGAEQAVITPIDGRYPAVEVQASAVENLLLGDYLAPIGYHWFYEMAVALVMAIVTAAFIQLVGVRWGTAAGLIVLMTVWTACGVLLARWGAYLSPLLPTLTMGAAVFAGVFTPIEQQRLRVDLVQRWRADQGHRRRRQAHEFLVKSLTSLMEIRDPSTGRHSRRTQGYSRLLAQRLAHMPEFHDYLTDERIEILSLLAPLHDIGKVGIRDAVLNKSSALTADEALEMRQHPVYGYEAISKAQRQAGVDSARDEEILQLAKDIVYTHHERWDGSGYPRGLHGEEIPLAGRIMALVDVYDALAEPRPYRRRLPHDEAVALIVGGRGSQFDPDVVEAFLTVATDFQELGTRLRETPPNSAA